MGPANEIEQRSATMRAIVHSVFVDHGLAPNYKKGKSELLIEFAGKDSKAVRSDFFSREDFPLLFQLSRFVRFWVFRELTNKQTVRYSDERTYGQTDTHANTLEEELLLYDPNLSFLTRSFYLLTSNFRRKHFCIKRKEFWEIILLSFYFI